MLQEEGEGEFFPEGEEEEFLMEGEEEEIIDEDAAEEGDGATHFTKAHPRFRYFFMIIELGASK